MFGANRGATQIRLMALIAFGLTCMYSMGEEGNMILSSKAFEEGTSIPARYTADGKDISPPLEWEGIPDGTQSLVLIIDDPDAPDPAAPRMIWVHWVLFNIPPDTTGLPEGVKTKKLPAGTGEGMNDWNRTGYGGPAPPIGRHRYVHKLYALDITLTGMGTPNKAKVVEAMQGHVLAEAKLVGTYERSK